MILAIGFRVRSKRGVQFRQWAIHNLREYMVKGFVIDDERLKNPDGRPDYFDELLERIREIRASEKRFYQKVRDLFLDSAELRVKERKDLTLSYWRNNVNALLQFQGKELLQGKGAVSRKQMEERVKAIYAEFDQRRKQACIREEELEEIRALKQLEESVLERTNERKTR